MCATSGEPQQGTWGLPRRQCNTSATPAREVRSGTAETGSLANPKKANPPTLTYKDHLSWQSFSLAPRKGFSNCQQISEQSTRREKPYSAKGGETKCSSSGFHPTLPLGKSGSVVVAPVTSPVTPLSDTGASLILASQKGIPSLDGLGSWSACSRGNSFHSPMAALATASAIPEYHAASPP